MVVILLLLSSFSYAQAVDLAVLGGGQISFNPSRNVGTGAVIQGNAGVRFLKAPLIALYAEVPITASFDINSGLPSSVAARDFRTLFVTPGVRLKLAPISPVSPFFTVGAGWARYTREGTESNTTNVFQFGGGVEFKIAPYMSLRTEVRDYYTGAPNIAVGFTERQHNVTAMGGLVLRF